MGLTIITTMRHFLYIWPALSAIIASASVESQVFKQTPALFPLQQDVGTADLFPMTDCFGFKLEEASIDEMQRAMEKGKLNSVGLVTCYMTRAFQTEQYIK